MTRNAIIRWLNQHGFLPIKSNTGHAHYKRPDSGVRITLPSMSKDLTKNEELTILRELERMGFQRKRVRMEVGG